MARPPPRPKKHGGPADGTSVGRDSQNFGSTWAKNVRPEVGHLGWFSPSWPWILELVGCYSLVKLDNSSAFDPEMQKISIRTIFSRVFWVATTC